MVMRRRTDVVVVGAGMAGLCASLAALEDHASVITVEKGSRSGGSMRLAGGLIWTFSSKSRLRDMIPDGNIALQDLVVDNLSAGHAWLQSHGVTLEVEEARPFGHGRQANPADMNWALETRLQELGGTLELETPMETVLYEDGAVCGVRVTTPDGTAEIEAGAVILATGGFQGNPDLLARYVTPHVDKVYLRANPWSTGDGFLAATGIGAAVTPAMSGFYGHALAAPPARFGPKQLRDMSQRYGPRCVAINLDGRRFVDESGGTGEEHIAQATAVQREATAIYIIDAQIAATPLPRYGLPRIILDRVRQYGGAVIERQTLAELCEALKDWGVVGDRALRTLQAYNQALAEGQPQRLDPPRQGNRLPLTTPPFIAVPIRPGITFTHGGLEVDTEMHVLRRSASISTLPLAIAEPSEVILHPIPNLFAAGCDVGNVHNVGYMGGLATALVTGRCAGREAAACARVGNRMLKR